MQSDFTLILFVLLIFMSLENRWLAVNIVMNTKQLFYFSGEKKTLLVLFVFQVHFMSSSSRKALSNCTGNIAVSSTSS